MFTMLAGWLGQWIGCFWHGLRDTFSHSWMRVYCEIIVIKLYLDHELAKNGRPKPIVVLAMVWIFLRCLRGDLDVLKILDDLAINIIAAHLYG
jgi:hypothetical protein